MPKKNKTESEIEKIAQKQKGKIFAQKSRGGKRKNLTKNSERKKLANIDKKIKNIALEKELINKEERQFLKNVKIFSIKLEVILKREANIENKIEEIEKLEKTVSPKKRSQIEKKRWEMETKRRKIEKEKWLIQEKIKKAEKKTEIIESRDQRLSSKKEKLGKEKELIFKKREAELAKKKAEARNKISQRTKNEVKKQQEVLTTNNPLIEKTKEVNLLLETSPEEEAKMKQQEEEKKRKEEELKKQEEKRKEEQKIKEENEQKRRQEEEARKTEEIKMKQEEEKKKKEEELKKQEEIRKAEELRKKQEEIKIQFLLPSTIKNSNKKGPNGKNELLLKTNSQVVDQGKKLGFLTKLFGKLTPHTKINAENSFDATKKGKEIEGIKEKLKEKIEGQKKGLIKQFEEELKTERDGLINQHKEELEKREAERKKQEEKVAKEKYIPYIPEELLKQQDLIKKLKKEEEDLRQRHKKELEKQAEEIKRRQKEELEKQEKEWERRQEEFVRSELEKKKKEDPKKDDVGLTKEQEREKREELEERRREIEEEVRKIEQERIRREELKKMEGKPMEGWEEELTEEEEKKKREELEIRRKEVEEEVKKIEQEELKREEQEKKKIEEKIKKEREELEREEKIKRLGKEVTKKGAIKDGGEELIKEKPLSKEEIQERERKEKELQPVFEMAVKNYKEKEFDKASDLFTKIKDQTVEPEKDPGFLAKLQNKLPLYIKAENYLKKIDKQRAIIENRTTKIIKKEAKKESEEKKKEERQSLPVQKDEWKKQPTSSTFFDFFRRKVAFYNPTIGIDISDSSIEIMYLNKQRSILAYGRTTINEGIIRDGEIINQKDLTQALRLTAQRAGFQPFDPRKGSLLKAIVNLPESKTYIQIFYFDSKVNLFESVKEKIESTIPFPINDLYWSYIGSLDENSKRIKVLCVAVLKDIVNSQIYFLKSSGISPIVFDIEAASIGRVFISEQKSERATLILDIGSQTTNLNIFDKNGFVSLSVTIRCAGNNFITKIADYLGIQKENAEIMMVEKGFKKDNNPFLTVLEEETRKIIEEVQQSINYYQGELGENIEKIILTGGSSLLPEIDTFFQGHFNKIKVEIGNPLEKIKRKGGLREERAILYSNVIGLALRSISKNPIRDGINLLPEEIKSRTK